LRSASSKTFFLLLSAAAAFGVLAWTAQREPPRRAFPLRIVVLPTPGSSSATYFTSGVDVVTGAGRGFFGRSGRASACRTVTWGRDGKTLTISQCTSSAGRWQLRKLP
jgi:hypothetical protein